MDITHVKTSRDVSDMAHGALPQLPLSVQECRMAERPARQIIAHWHNAFEFIRVLDGTLDVQVGDKSELLSPGDCLFINSRQVHASAVYVNSNKNNNNMDCRYLCVLAGLDLFAGSHWVRDKLIGPLVDDSDFTHALLDAESAHMVDRIHALDKLSGVASCGDVSQSIEALGLLYLVLARAVAQRSGRSCGLITSLDNPEIVAQKDMLSFISQHYDEKITLAEIATAGCVCRSKCCSIFKKYLRQSPIEFLNSYRLTASLTLLRETDMRIADIALSCGFGHQSYYTKMFGRKYGYTPNEYRSRTRRAA